MKHKNNVIYVITTDDLFNRDKPRYNGYIVGHGPHKNKKAYCRREKHPKGKNYDF